MNRRILLTKIRLVPFLIFFFLITGRCFAQSSFLLTYQNGSEQGYYIAASGKLYFANNELVVLPDVNSTPTTIPISIIRKITFSGSVGNFVNAKIYLSNFDTGSNLMSAYLTSESNFPSSDPYRTAPFNTKFVHVNNSVGASLSPLLLSVTGANAIVDWIFLSLESDAGAGTTVAATKTGLIQSDGDIVSEDGTSAVRFDNVASGDYYFKVSHRNHLSFRTLNKVAIGSNILNLDLTSSSTASFGPMQTLSASKKGLVGGDANFDESIDATDTILWEQQNGLFDDYSINSDYNADGSCDAFDTIIWELNNGLFYP